MKQEDTAHHSPGQLLRRRLLGFVLGLGLVAALGAGMQSCLFLDVLTGLYTGTYVEYTACSLTVSDCGTLSTAHDACVDEKNIGHPECRAIWDQFWDCIFCTSFPDIPPIINAAAGQAQPLRTAGSTVLFWTQSGNRILRSVDGGATVEEVLDFDRYPLGLALDAAGGKVYWTDGRTRRLRRANLDGSGAEDLLTGIAGMTGLALDAAGGALYLGLAGDGKIQRLDLSTRTVEDVATGQLGPTDLAFDAGTGMLYWTDNGRDGGAIRRLAVYGSGTVEDVVTGQRLPFGLALDPAAGYLYWSDPADGVIRRAGLDGSGVEDVLTGLGMPVGLALDPARGDLYWTNPQDIQIRRAGLDGSGIETLLSTPAADLAVDAADGRLYWTGWVAGSVNSVGLDGSGFQAIDRRNILEGNLAVDPIGGKLYWSVRTTGRIQRANFDGSGVEDVGPVQPGLGAVAFDAVRNRLYWTAGGNVMRSDPDGASAETILTGLFFIGDIEVDAVGGKLYWITQQQIQRANLDGTQRETFYTDAGYPEALAVHPGSGALYWTVPSANVIRRANLDGTGVVADVVTGVPLPAHIAASEDALYWTAYGARKIQRSNLDGTGVADVLTNVSDPSGLIVVPAAVVPVELVSFDAVAEGRDVLLRWATASETNNAGFEVEARSEDAEQRAWSDWRRLALVEGRGTTAAPQQYQYRAENLPPGRHRFRLKQIDFDGTFTYGPEVEVSIELATAFQLDPAYPNPFNPHTRFTLSVSRTQDVQIVVYDVQGRPVDRLYSGPLEAGRPYTFTLDGSRWASGVYFYEVTGADFRARRPVLLVK